MKTVLAAIAAVVLTSALPAAASEPGLELRRNENVMTSGAAARDATASAPVAEAAPTKKIRVVLASPYGN